LPIDTFLLLIAVGRPRVGFAYQNRFIFDPAIKALFSEYRQFTLGDIQPTSMFGSIPKI